MLLSMCTRLNYIKVDLDVTVSEGNSRSKKSLRNTRLVSNH